jgi:predicted nucleic acid-binding protein
MTLVADTSGIVALYDAADPEHAAALAALEAEADPPVVSVAILAEIDYLLQKYLGPAAALDFIDSLRRGAFALEAFTAGDLERCRELVAQYASLELGLADAAVLATAERLGSRRVLTLDRRHFGVVRSRRGDVLELLPARVERR